MKAAAQKLLTGSSFRCIC